MPLETFPWNRQPGVQRARIEQLATLDFVGQASNLVFIGPTGVGKTGLAAGILLRALFAGRRAQLVKAQDLVDDLFRSLADHSSRKLLDRMMRVEVLLIDELGYLNLRPEQSNIFFKLMEERNQRRLCTMVTTNLDYEEWYAFLGQKAMVAALLDRLRHRCITLRIDGLPSEHSNRLTEFPEANGDRGFPQDEATLSPLSHRAGPQPPPRAPSELDYSW